MICQHVRLRRDDTHLAWGMIYAVHHSNKCPVCVCVFQARYHGNILLTPLALFWIVPARVATETDIRLYYFLCVCVCCLRLSSSSFFFF